MAEAVLHLQRIVRALAVVLIGPGFVNLLVQAAAKRHVHLWNPRQMPNTGIPASTAARISGRVRRSRNGS